MGTSRSPFEFHATLDRLPDGLEILHDSVERLRVFALRKPDDRALTQFETALGEIGANVLTHGSPLGDAHPVEYRLRFDGDAAEATLTDAGPSVEGALSRAMPAPGAEAGRGLTLARLLLDELGYRREGDVNRWRLVKRL